MFPFVVREALKLLVVVSSRPMTAMSVLNLVRSALRYIGVTLSCPSAEEALVVSFPLKSMEILEFVDDIEIFDCSAIYSAIFFRSGSVVSSAGELLSGSLVDEFSKTGWLLEAGADDGADDDVSEAVHPVNRRGNAARTTNIFLFIEISTWGVLAIS